MKALAKTDGAAPKTVEPSGKLVGRRRHTL